MKSQWKGNSDKTQFLYNDPNHTNLRHHTLQRVANTNPLVPCAHLSEWKGPRPMSPLPREFSPWAMRTTNR
jgi:hypothetical protein